jgi:hypothetical protein
MVLTGTGVGLFVVSDYRGDKGEEIVVGLRTESGREIPINGNPVHLAEILLSPEIGSQRKNCRFRPWSWRGCLVGNSRRRWSDGSLHLRRTGKGITESISASVDYCMDNKLVQSGMGDLACFVFKGQCYDAGLQSKTKCTLCGRAIRHVYILKNPQDRSVPIGSCCFSKFQTINPKIHTQLEAARIWLDTTLEAEQRDIRQYQPRTTIQDRMAAWRKAKTAALKAIRDYKKTSGEEWLPKPLFELELAARKTPGTYKRPANTARWYEKQTETLHAKIQEVSGTN